MLFIFSNYFDGVVERKTKKLEKQVEILEELKAKKEELENE